MTFTNTGKLTKGQNPEEHEKLGSINILWASNSGMTAITKATIKTAAGSTDILVEKVDTKI